MKNHVKCIAVTGANGFIGSQLIKFFLEKGLEVVALSRKNAAAEHPQLRWQYYDLEQGTDEGNLMHVDAIVHCAFAVFSSQQTNADELNIGATKRLADFCMAHQKKFVFLSSFSAHEQALSHYGKHKFQLEKLLEKNHLVIKPGLVIGQKGLYNNMAEMIRAKRFFPVIDNGQQPIQFLRVNELCVAIYQGIINDLCGTFPVASEQAMTYLSFCEAIAEKEKRSPFFVFLPSSVLKLLIAIFGKKLPVSRENLEGLLQLRSFDTKDSNRLLGVVVKNEI